VIVYNCVTSPEICTPSWVSLNAWGGLSYRSDVFEVMGLVLQKCSIT